MWPQYKTDFSTDKYRYSGKVIKHQVCVQIFKGLQIQADGEVVPCCVDWNRVNLLGNIKKDSLLDIWNGKKLRDLQIKHLQGKKAMLDTCKDCTMNDYCDVDNIDLYKEECMKRLLPSEDMRFELSPRDPHQRVSVREKRHIELI